MRVNDSSTAQHNSHDADTFTVSLLAFISLDHKFKPRAVLYTIELASKFWCQANTDSVSILCRSKSLNRFQSVDPKVGIDSKIRRLIDGELPIPSGS